VQLTKFFYLSKINKIKFKHIKRKAVQLRFFRNYISYLYFEHIKKHQKLPNMFDIIKQETKVSIKYLVNKDMEYAIKEVNTSYVNKMKQKRPVEDFFVTKDIQFSYYKKKTKKHEKGELKNIKIIKKDKILPIYVSFMSKKEPNNWIEWLEYIELVIENTTNNEIKDFYINFKKYLMSKPKKFVDRMIKLAKDRKERVFLNFWKKQNEFKSLSYKTQSRISDEIIGENKNENSCISHFINIGAYNGKKLHLPIKYHSKYHKINSKYVTTYNMTFREEEFYRVELSYEEVECEIELNDEMLKEENVVGVDVNSKHNIFYTSEGEELMIDKRYIEKAVKYLKLQDKNNSKYIKSKVDQQRRAIKYEIDKLISILIKGKTHIVLEDLTISNGKLRSVSTEHDIINNRLINLLNLSDLKNRIRYRAMKRGIMVSFVPTPYTSQKCNVCKNIDKANRNTQEKFICTCCANEDNADNNASKNVKEIIVDEVLRQLLLRFTGKYFEPLSLSKDKIRMIYSQI